LKETRRLPVIRAHGGGLHRVAPRPSFSGFINVYTSVKATYYAPSDLAGRSGMHREVIRSSGRWYGKYARRDTVLVRYGEPNAIMGGLRVGRVVRFISFSHLGLTYECALVEWLDPVGNTPDALTGMWKLQAAQTCDGRSMELVRISSIVRSCHLIPVYGTIWVPRDFHHSQSLVAFSTFYLNHYSDYHAFETFPRA
jgi:hypothetical protein